MIRNGAYTAGIPIIQSIYDRNPFLAVVMTAKIRLERETAITSDIMAVLSSRRAPKQQSHVEGSGVGASHADSDTYANPLHQSKVTKIVGVLRTKVG